MYNLMYRTAIQESKARYFRERSSPSLFMAIISNCDRFKASSGSTFLNALLNIWDDDYDKLQGLMRDNLEKGDEQLKNLPDSLRQYASYEFVKKLIQSYQKVNMFIVELKSDALKEDTL